MTTYRDNAFAEEKKPMEPLQKPDDEETKQFRIGAWVVAFTCLLTAGSCGGYWIHNDRCLVEKERIEAEKKRYEVELEMWKHIPRWSDPDAGK